MTHIQKEQEVPVLLQIGNKDIFITDGGLSTGPALLKNNIDVSSTKLKKFINIIQK